MPFLDHELVELAAACPPELKLAHGGKGVLKEAARGVVPDAVIDRTKGYFPVPAIRHLEGPYLERVRDAVDAPVGQGPRPVPPRLARRDARRPEHAAHHPRLERAVAGGAAGDVVAGEGDLADCPISSNGSPPGAGRSRIPRPAPSPDGQRLAWISDADGRPRAWLADLEPSGSVKEPDRPLSRPRRRHRRSRGRPTARGSRCRWPRTAANAPRCTSSTRPPARSATSRRAPPRPPSAPGRPPAAWSASPSSPRAAATARPASSTSATARPRCSRPGPPHGCARCRATGGAPSSGWAAAAPATWSWSTCAPGGAPS